MEEKINSFNDQLNYFNCKACGRVVLKDYVGLPISNYWSNKLKEVYCGPKHSLDRHEEMKNVD